MPLVKVCEIKQSISFTHSFLMNIFELMNLKLDFFSMIPLLTPLDVKFPKFGSRWQLNFCDFGAFFSLTLILVSR